MPTKGLLKSEEHKAPERKYDLGDTFVWVKIPSIPRKVKVVGYRRQGVNWIYTISELETGYTYMSALKDYQVDKSTLHVTMSHEEQDLQSSLKDIYDAIDLACEDFAESVYPYDGHWSREHWVKVFNYYKEHLMKKLKESLEEELKKKKKNNQRRV